MPALFPTLQPDELIYSAIARYSDMLHFRSELRLWRSLFGGGTPQVSTDFTGQIGLLLSRLSPRHGYTARSLVRDHTLFPYYAHFVERETAETGVKMLASKDRMQAISPVKILGLLDPWQKSPSHLRYCTACIGEDTDRPFGEPYWHRVHQLAGVLLCPTHEIPLLISSAERFWRETSPAFLSLRRALRRESTVIKIPSRHREVLLAIAKDSRWLLLNERSIEEKPTVWNRSLCLRRGWGYSTGTRMHFQKMLEAFLDHWDTDFWSSLLPEIPIQAGDAATWLRQITLPSRSMFVHHPLKHILLHRFLESNIDGAGASEGNAPPQNTPSVQDIEVDAPCMNPVCGNYNGSNSMMMEDVVRGLADGEGKCFVVKCDSCGFVEKRSTTPGKQYRRILETGGIWDSKFEKLVRDGLSLGAIGKKLGVSRTFVESQATRTGLWSKSWGSRPAPQVSREARAKAMVAKRTATYRSAWKTLRRKYPDETRFQLGKRDSTVYKHLLAKDREWFEENAPPIRSMSERAKMSGKRKKSDAYWRERDSELLAKVKDAVREIKSLPEVPRITIGRLVRHVGESNPIKSIMPDKLPNAWKYVNGVAENMDQRTKRAIWCFAEMYADEGVVPGIISFHHRSRINWDQCRKYRAEIEEALEAIRMTVEFGVSFPQEKVTK